MAPLKSAAPGIASVGNVQAWIDAAFLPLAAEPVRLGAARGRVLAAAVRADKPLPDRDRALVDGFAVRASDSLGAAAYNPVAVAAIAVAAGDPMSPDTDAVVPLGAAELEGPGKVIVVEPVAAGANVEAEGAVANAGTVLMPAGTRLAPRHIGLLAAAGIGEMTVVTRPRIAILLAGAPRLWGTADGNRAMIGAAAQRDGAVVTEIVEAARERRSLAGALAAVDAELALVIGGTGPGPDDHAAAALAEAGDVAFHGVAMRPGETAGFGRTGNGIPVALLPGGPAACLWSYEMLAGRAVRRLAGHPADLPFHRRTMQLGRKIVSAIGLTEICPVRFGAREATVEPLPGFAEIGLMAAVGGDGVVVVPEGSEGYPQEASVEVYLYESHRGNRQETKVRR